MGKGPAGLGWFESIGSRRDWVMAAGLRDAEAASSWSGGSVCFVGDFSVER